MWKAALIVIVITLLYAALFKLITKIYVDSLPMADKIGVAITGKKREYPKYLTALGVILVILTALSVISLVYLAIYAILLL